MRAWLLAAAATHGREPVLFDGRTHALGGNHALLIISVQQKRRKLFTAKTRAHVARPQSALDHCANFFQRFAAGQVTVGVVHLLKMIQIHH